MTDLDSPATTQQPERLTMHTYQTITEHHAVELPVHLEAQAEIPVLSGPQRQGDLFILPQRPGAAVGEPVKPEGVAVIRGVAGGNTHLLVADGDVKFRTLSNGQDLGIVTVTQGATAFLLHPEHGAQAFAPGEYLIRRQREQADEIRLIAD